MSDFESVGAFHKKFGLATADDGRPTTIVPELRDFRLKFLLEELEELAEGYGLKLRWELIEKSIPNVGKDGCPDCGYNGPSYYDRRNHPHLDLQDLPKIADALVDLVYVALGCAQLHRLPWNALFSDVQRANLSKERAASDGSNSMRKSSFDVVKPIGWVAPQTIEVLMRAGWPGPELPLEEK